LLIQEATVPGAGFADTEFVPFRSDYMLATPRLAERATSWVVRTPTTDRARITIRSSSNSASDDSSWRRRSRKSNL
jgi:hypothetical protein